MSTPCLISRLTLLLALSLPSLLHAAAPAPFMVRYNASYGSFNAESTRSLQLDAASGHYVMLAETRLTLLGANLSSIRERSEFLWQDDAPQPLLYSYEQKGIGARNRNIRFDQEQHTLTWAADGKSGSLPFTEPVYDDLTSFIEIRRQLLQGRDDIQFNVVDKDTIDPYHYQVLGQDTLKTPIGEYSTVHLMRVRDANSVRSTEFWLAPDLDYVLLKLRHMEPDKRLIQLNVQSLERR
ncbi:MAG: DUF3108 domain-containing protein [Pseudomonadales bacterium]|jgi:hypothetical protein|nr:DUF3108 domain-containing protein [Pseudomonadales bacterium]